MSKSYNEIMEKISVTEEMRERILDNVQANNIAEYRKRSFAARARKASFLAVAAVIAVISGTLLLHNFQDRTNTEEPPLEQEMMTQTYNGIEECASLQELEKKVGFEVEDLEKLLPFTPSKADYLSYWQELAEIQYTGENQTIIFRKSSGEEDNSGDYNEYAVEKEIVVAGMDILQKGNEDGIKLVIWNHDGFSYSVSFENAVPQEAVDFILREINLK